MLKMLNNQIMFNVMLNMLKKGPSKYVYRDLPILHHISEIEIYGNCV